MKLYELTEAIESVQRLVDDGELEFDDVADTLEGLLPEARERASNIAALAQNQEAEIAALKAAEKKIADRRKAVEKNRDYWLRYLLDNMERCRIEEISTPEWKVKVALNPPSVAIAADAEIPKAFMVEKVTQSPDKKALKAALDAGVVFKGIELVRGKRLKFS
jgi:hypothetical protein